MSRAKPSFPYAHRTIAQIDAQTGGGGRVRRFSERGSAAPAVDAEAAMAPQSIAASAPAGRSPRLSAGGASWPERAIAIRDAAREHLKDCGFVVQRKSLNDLVPLWSVSHFNGWFSTEQLIQLAKEYGFDPAAVQCG